MREQILSWLERSCDFIFERRNYPPVDHSPVPMVIAHRGAWDLHARRENTLRAFQEAKALGMGGIELDVHFTKDGVPVVSHDPHLRRLFADSGRIADLSFAEVSRRAPEIPALETVLALPDLHFMIEIKMPLTTRPRQILGAKLSHLRAVQDFHLLVLDPALVCITPEFPANCWILVGQLRLGPLVDISLARGYAGVAGHFLAMTKNLIARLHAAGQRAGTGFISSRNILNREHARGIDWVFTNAAENLSHE